MASFKTPRLGRRGIAPIILLAAALGCSAAAQHSSTLTLAEVNGESITEDDVSQSLGQALARVEDQVYRLKAQRLQAMIAEKLVAAEAKQRGTDPNKLLDKEVTAKTTMVTDEEVAAFCASNSAACGGPSPLPEAREAVRTRVQQQKLAARHAEFVESLKAAANVKVYLEPPPAFRAEVELGDLPLRGPAGAAVTIVEFSDFHCTFCRRAQPIIEQLLKKYPTQVRLAYRDLPLDKLHPEARRAAEAARCANDQGKFWAFHDALYKGPAAASDATLQALSTAVGLDATTFNNCVASGKHRDAVQRDADVAARLGSTGTPSIFINGRPMLGAKPLEEFVQITEEELAGHPARGR